METLTDKNLTFQVSDSPIGKVWNIGRENFPHPGFIPMFTRNNPNNPAEIDTSSLVAYHIADEDKALAIIRMAQFKEVDAELIRMYLADTRTPFTPLNKRFYTIEALKASMYASRMWKANHTLAIVRYINQLRLYVSMHDYYQYQVYQQDDLYMAENKAHIYYAVREVFTDFDIDTFERWYKQSLKEWEDANGYA